MFYILCFAAMAALIVEANYDIVIPTSAWLIWWVLIAIRFIIAGCAAHKEKNS